jgi:hypothetical protein
MTSGFYTWRENLPTPGVQRRRAAAKAARDRVQPLPDSYAGSLPAVPRPAAADETAGSR